MYIDRGITYIDSEGRVMCNTCYFFYYEDENPNTLVVVNEDNEIVTLSPQEKPIGYNFKNYKNDVKHSSISVPVGQWRVKHE